ncbi:MAG: bifunctional oligoribonuclease/PAP phosphatase NrnA [Mycoplasmataceae bacterium]|nr:bifunctional oligoribonuclease/PAP phosphatase NrnA [Mycoplasmataceae bacterium]
MAQANKISLLVHELPDGDALGSAYGIKSFLNNKFPKKDVKIIGINDIKNDFLEALFGLEKEKYDDEWISQSLGIILDTANEERILGQKHKLCKFLIRIDHHPYVNKVANIEWIDDLSSSTCEMVTRLLNVWDHKRIDAHTSAFLYTGLLTDTNRFLHPNTTSDTLLIASLLSQTKFDKNRIHHILYTKSYDVYRYEKFLSDKIEFNTTTHIASLLIPKDAHLKFKIKEQTSMVHLLGGITEFAIWTTLYYEPKLKNWKGSIRSYNIDVRPIAMKYHGGGHKFAVGFKLENVNDFKKVIADLATLTKKSKK